MARAYPKNTKQYEALKDKGMSKERAAKIAGNLPGLHVLEDELIEEQASHDLDVMHVLIDVSELGINDYQAADRARATHAIDFGLSDHRRIEATLSMADTAPALERLLSVLQDLTRPCG